MYLTRVWMILWAVNEYAFPQTPFCVITPLRVLHCNKGKDITAELQVEKDIEFLTFQFFKAEIHVYNTCKTIFCLFSIPEEVGGQGTSPWIEEQGRITRVWQTSHTSEGPVLCSPPKVNYKGTGEIKPSDKYRVWQQRCLLPALPLYWGEHFQGRFSWNQGKRELEQGWLYGEGAVRGKCSPT